MDKQQLSQLNHQMANRIKTGPAAPYQEGNYVLRVLVVTGRRSGRTIELPIGYQHSQKLFLIPPDPIDRGSSICRPIRSAP